MRKNYSMTLKRAGIFPHGCIHHRGCGPIIHICRCSNFIVSACRAGCIGHVGRFDIRFLNIIDGGIICHNIKVAHTITWLHQSHCSDFWGLYI